MGRYDFDYIVIGSGPAGRTAAEKLAAAHKKVAIIESDSLGGAEINTRDLPYKIALDFADTYHKFMNLKATNSNHHFNLPTLSTYIDSAVKSASSRIQTELNSLNIKIIHGFANFLDDHTVAVENDKYTAQNFILATDLKANEISGLDSIDFITPDNVFKIHRMPRYVFIVGGGPTGVQLAEFFAKLGAGVIIMERGDHLLPREDDEISEYVTDYFTGTLGVSVMTNSKVLQITEDSMSKIVVFMSSDGKKMVRVDSIVLATGSEPFTDYGLENAGVEYKRGGITVDKYFNTSAKNIFAIGDCLGGQDSSTERAIEEAEILVENLLHRQKTSAEYTDLVRHIGIHPEIAVLGLNEHDAVSRDIKYKRDITELDDGFAKIITDRGGHFLGASVVTTNAKSALDLHKLLQK